MTERQECSLCVPFSTLLHQEVCYNQRNYIHSERYYQDSNVRERNMDLRSNNRNEGNGRNYSHSERYCEDSNVRELNGDLRFNNRNESNGRNYSPWERYYQDSNVRERNGDLRFNNRNGSNGRNYSPSERYCEDSNVRERNGDLRYYNRNESSGRNSIHPEGYYEDSNVRERNGGLRYYNRNESSRRYSVHLEGYYEESNVRERNVDLRYYNRNESSGRNSNHSEGYYEENNVRERNGDRKLNNRNESRNNNNQIDIKHALWVLEKTLYVFPGMPIKEFHQFLSEEMNDDVARLIYDELSSRFIQKNQKVYLHKYFEDLESDDDEDQSRNEDWFSNLEMRSNYKDDEEQGLVPLFLLRDILNLFKENPNGLYLEELPGKYEEMFGRIFSLRMNGFYHLLHFVCSLSCTFRIYCTGVIGQYVIVYAPNCDDDCYDIKALQRTLNRLKTIVYENANGVDVNDVERMYKERFGFCLNVKRIGFSEVRGLFKYLDRLVTIREENGKEIIVKNMENGLREIDEQAVVERNRHEDEVSIIFQQLAVEDAKIPSKRKGTKA